MKYLVTPVTSWGRFIARIKKGALFLSEHPVAMGLFVFSLLLVVLVFSLVGVHFFGGVDIPFVKLQHSDSAQYWGQLGDFVGGMLNPLLSFAALMAILYSTNLQRKELRAVREETLRANRIQDQQTTIYRRQRVESSLLELISWHSKIASELVVRNGNKRTYVGREAFNYLDSALKEELDKDDSRAHQLRVQAERPDANILIMPPSDPLKFYLFHADNLSRYMRNVYQILKFIDTNIEASEDVEVSELRRNRAFVRRYREQRELSNIFRAQLDRHELQMIFLNIHSPAGAGLKYYAEKYSLFKDVDLSRLRSHVFANDLHSFAYADYQDMDLNALYRMDVRHRNKLARATLQQVPRKDSVSGSRNLPLHRDRLD